MPWTLACRQWQGGRPYQEDAFATLEIDIAGTEETNALLMVLADGMGGVAGGAVASRIVVETFPREFPKSSGKTGARFRECLEAATNTLREQEANDPQLIGMGSTVVAVLYDGRGMDWLSVGDSPMWLFTGGRLVRLNADHSMIPVLQELVRTGELLPEEVHSHRQRNMLRSMVTSTPAELVDCAHRSGSLQPGEYLLIASDGIDTLSKIEIAQTLQLENSNAEAAADALLHSLRSVASPAQDNLTFLLLSAEVP